MFLGTTLWTAEYDDRYRKVADLQRKVKRPPRKNRDRLQDNFRIKKGITKIFKDDQTMEPYHRKAQDCTRDLDVNNG
ncbi:hypothetical protein HPB52_013527 [Rhipicephalus sanguineus]|uniref:Uncharacterized protein n=1 Tax=Rhipicephalus sanguineus TaxID=34632 RepID=A0A9D4T3R3_RHISA|nr:hypothetical protein HPB52_013527 [Rhipicephalus sanguineus]